VSSGAYARQLGFTTNLRLKEVLSWGLSSFFIKDHVMTRENACPFEVIA